MIDATVTEVATFNVLPVVAFALIWNFKLFSESGPCIALASTMAIINILLLISALRRRRYFDALWFSVPLPACPVEQRERLRAVVSGTERYLAANRISYTSGKAGGPYAGRIGAPEKSFRLEGAGLRFEIFRNARGGPGRTEAELFLGPVADKTDPVARKLLEGLRQELLRPGEGPPPGKSG